MPTIAIRGQAPIEARASQTQTMTYKSKSTKTIPSRIGGSTTHHGRLNPDAYRPGLHAPNGPQPFISKFRISNPNIDINKIKLDDRLLKDHATSSRNSKGVSFTRVDGVSSMGFKAQLGWAKSGFIKRDGPGKSYITTTSLGAMKENPYSSGTESEYLGQGFRHQRDPNMMQHSIKNWNADKKSKTSGFSLTSRNWIAATNNTPGRWGSKGKSMHFTSIDEAFKEMVGRAGNPHAPPPRQHPMIHPLGPRRMSTFGPRRMSTFTGGRKKFPEKSSRDLMKRYAVHLSYKPKF